MSAVIIDLSLDYQHDLELDTVNDLHLVYNNNAESLDKAGDTDDYYQQAITRLLITNPLSYIWQPQYGVGVESDIGDPMSASRLSSIQSQTLLGLRSIPGILNPTAVVTPYNSGSYIQLVITYTVAATNTQRTNTFLLQA